MDVVDKNNEREVAVDRAVSGSNKPESNVLLVPDGSEEAKLSNVQFVAASSSVLQASRCALCPSRFETSIFACTATSGRVNGQRTAVHSQQHILRRRAWSRTGRVRLCNHELGGRVVRSRRGSSGGASKSKGAAAAGKQRRRDWSEYSRRLVYQRLSGEQPCLVSHLLRKLVALLRGSADLFTT